LFPDLYKADTEAVQVLVQRASNKAGTPASSIPGEHGPAGAGDKAGKWAAWYRQAIPLAEQRYEDYLKQEDIR
jgi:hypothetical protein